MFLQVNTGSWTGKFLYSDCYNVRIPEGKYEGSEGIPYPEDFSFHKPEIPFLNRFANVPVFGRLAGVCRVALAIIHSLGHLFAALCTQNKDHLKHAVKGGTELLRGMIEMIPVIGLLFSWVVNATFDLRPNHSTYSYSNTFFLVKLTNQSQLDKIDALYVAQKMHPQSEQLENKFALEHEKIILPYLNGKLKNYEKAWDNVEYPCTSHFMRVGVFQSRWHNIIEGLKNEMKLRTEIADEYRIKGDAVFGKLLEKQTQAETG